MPRYLKILLLSSGMSVISYLLGEFVFFKHVTQWTMYLTGKQLIYHVPVIDAVLFRLYPLITGTVLLLVDRNVSIKKCICVIILAFPCIIAFLLAGFLTGLYWIWPELGNSSHYTNVISQSFRYYWTPFILAGIFISVLLVRTGKTIKNEQVIDD